MTDTPTLEQVGQLLETHPEYFSSPLQTARSLRNAEGAVWSAQEATARAQYGDYLSNGGPAIGPAGEMPQQAPTLDQQFGSAACDCGAASPCCLTGLKFSCSHGSDRLVLPLADDTVRPLIVLVSDKDPNPGHDEIRITPDYAAQPDCGMPDKKPLLCIRGSGHADLPIDTEQSWNAPYNGDGALGSTDLERFIRATRLALFTDITRLASTYDLEILSCARRSELNAKVEVYPKLEWACSGFYYDIKGTYFSNGMFQPSIKLGGSISGKYLASTFTVSGDGGDKPDPQGHSKSLIPFIDSAISRMQSATAQGSTPVRENTTYSNIEVRHKVEMGASTFKVAEHPSDPAKVGIEGEIDMQFAPLFGITARLDLLDALLTAANGTAPGLAEALRKARERLAQGVGSRDREQSNFHLSAHAAVRLEVFGNIGNAGVRLSRPVGADRWEGTGRVGGEVGIRVVAEIRADGRAYIVSGTFSADASAASKLKANLKTLTAAEQEAASGAKFNAKVEWTGVTLNYSVQAQATFLGINTGTKNESGSIKVLDAETLYESNF